MATLKDIARHLDISISTASLALRDHPSISIKTKQRVWAAQEALGYRAPLRAPGGIASKPKKQGAGVRDVAFLLVSRDFEDPRYASVFQQMAAYAAERQWRPIFLTSTVSDLESGIIPPLLRNGGIHGLIVSGDYPVAGHEHLKRLGIPMVMFGRYQLGDEPWMSCEPDFSQSVNLFINRMKEMGHKRFGLVIDGSYSDTYSGFLRRAYEEALAHHQLKSVGIAATQHSQKREYLSLNGLIRRRPTAILLGSVYQANEAYAACHKAGLRIPDDISILSFGDGRIYVASPSLAYLAQEHGSARRLIDKLTAALDRPGEPITRELFPKRLVPGGSIGPAPVEK